MLPGVAEWYVLTPRSSLRQAMKWLRCYLDEKEPALKNFAQVVRSLEERRLD